MLLGGVGDTERKKPKGETRQGPALLEPKECSWEKELKGHLKKKKKERYAAKSLTVIKK